MRTLTVGLVARMRALVLLAAVLLLAAPFAASAETQAPDTNKAESLEKAPANAERAANQAEEARPATKKININKATAKELESLPGIGPALSKRIIEGRPYAKIEDIKKVKGIGEKTFEKIKDKITVK